MTIDTIDHKSLDYLTKARQRNRGVGDFCHLQDFNSHLVF